MFSLLNKPDYALRTILKGLYYIFSSSGIIVSVITIITLHACQPTLGFMTAK